MVARHPDDALDQVLVARGGQHPDELEPLARPCSAARPARRPGSSRPDPRTPRPRRGRCHRSGSPGSGRELDRRQHRADGTKNACTTNARSSAEATSAITTMMPISWRTGRSPAAPTRRESPVPPPLLEPVDAFVGASGSSPRWRSRPPGTSESEPDGEGVAGRGRRVTAPVVSRAMAGASGLLGHLGRVVLLHDLCAAPDGAGGRAGRSRPTLARPGRWSRSDPPPGRARGCRTCPVGG